MGPRSRTDAEDYRWGLTRFLEEAQTLAKFDHPHVVRVYRVLEAWGTAYLVTEYIEGLDGRARSLKDKLTAVGTLPESRVRTILDALTSGLAPVGNGNRKRDLCGHVKWDPQVLRQNINSGPSWLKSIPGLSGRICL